MRTYLGAVFRHLARRGKKRAVMATDRHILIAAYATLKGPERLYNVLCKLLAAYYNGRFAFSLGVGRV